jgi:hypothetical protein
MVLRLLTSPRARRRGAALVSAIAAVAALALASRLLPDGRELDDAAAQPAAPFAAQQPAQAPAEPRRVPLRPADRRAIDRALDRFVPAAVSRRDPALAYELVTPALRAGTTRAEWSTGTIPVQPFPARGRRFHHWTLSYSHPNHVGLELLLKPKREGDLGAIAFAVDVKKLRGRWLVDSFIPAAVFSGGGAPPRISAVPDFGATGGTRSPGSGRLRPVWFLVPGAILSLALVILLGYGVSTWLRGRRVVRAYEAEPSDARKLPPLPAPTRSRIALARAGRNR